MRKSPNPTSFIFPVYVFFLFFPEACLSLSRLRNSDFSSRNVELKRFIFHLVFATVNIDERDCS